MRLVHSTPRRRLVMIGVPSFSGTVNVVLASWISDLRAQGASEPKSLFGFVACFVAYKQPVEYARNLLVREFLASDADLLWMIDEDMIPTATTAMLLSIDADIVVGRALSPHRTKDGLAFKALLFNASGPEARGGFDTWSGKATYDPIDIDAGGTGCMIVKRRVLESPKMRAPGVYVDRFGDRVDHDRAPRDADWCPAIFRTIRRADGAPDRAEDLDFCWRAKRAGFSIKGHTIYGMGHLKSMNCDSVLETIARSRARAASAKEGNG